MDYLINSAITLLVSGAVFGWYLATRRREAATKIEQAALEAERITRDARREADALRKEALLEAKEQAHELRLDAEKQIRDRSDALALMEQSIARRETAASEQRTQIDEQQRALRTREQVITERERATQATAARFDQLVAERQRELERVARLTADEAHDILLKQIESDARRDAAQLVKRLEAEAREVAVDRAKQIIADAIQRSAAEHSIETTVSVVDLPSDDLKGRIIGREGRNIRALELATGVELIVDDTPGAI